MGNLLDYLERQIVWEAAAVVSLLDRSEWRSDVFGNLMKLSDYGDRTSPYGWEVDHIVPLATGGSDTLANKRALHWRANAKLGSYVAQLLGLGDEPRKRTGATGLGR